MTHRRLATLGLLLVLALAAPTVLAHEEGTGTASSSQLAPAPPTWVLGSIANGVMALIFALIAIFLWHAILQGNQLWSNPMLTGIALIFTTCGIGHLIHFEHTLLPLYAPLVGETIIQGGVPAAVSFGDLARVGMAAPLLVAGDLAAAGSAVYYWTLRGRHREVVRGAELTDDLDVREREAEALHDTVVQSISEALLLLDLDREDEAAAAMGRAMEQAKGAVEVILGDRKGVPALGEGDLHPEA